jgi:hypothetical protein
MLPQLPPELLRMVTFYLEGADLLQLSSTGNPLLTHRLTDEEGCVILAFEAPHNLQTVAKTLPKGLARFRRLDTITLRPELLESPSKFSSTPESDWVQVMPASLTKLSIIGENPLNSFIRPQIANLASKPHSTHQILIQWAMLYESGADNDPWLPLESLFPNLKSLEVLSKTMVHHPSNEHCESLGDAIWRFVGHLPPTLREFHCNLIHTGFDKWAAALPRNLESWTCPSSPVRSIGWEPLYTVPRMLGAPRRFLGGRPGLVASEAHHLPTTLTNINIDGIFELECLAHLPSLTQLACEALSFAPGSQLASQGVPICSVLPKTLTDLHVQRLLQNDADLCTPQGRLPTQLLKLSCVSAKNVNAFLSFLPPGLRSLELTQYYSPIPGDVSDIALFPHTLTSLTFVVSNLSLASFTCFPPQLRILRVTHSRTQEKMEASSILRFPFLSHIEHLELTNTPSLELTNEILESMPNALEIHMNAATIHERHIPKRRHSRLRQLTVNCVIISGHGMHEALEQFRGEEAEPGIITTGLLMTSFTAWLRSSDRVRVTTIELDVLLERLPPGVTALKNMTWHSSDVDSLPPTLTELSGHFQLSYQDIPRLPKSVKALRDCGLVIDDKAAAEIFGKLASPNRSRLTLPFDLYTECCIGTEIQNFVSPNGSGCRATITDEALSKIWPQLTTLSIAESAPLLTSQSLKYIPRTLTKLRILHQPFSTLLWSIIPELQSLTSLTTIPRENLILEDFQHLPGTLSTLELNHPNSTSSTQQSPESQLPLLKIPMSAISALPASLTQLSIMWPNDLPDSVIELLPRNLKELKLQSPNIIDPPFHHFPTPLTIIVIKPGFTGSHKLLSYLQKKRKSLK